MGVGNAVAVGIDPQRIGFVGVDAIVAVAIFLKVDQPVAVAVLEPVGNAVAVGIGQVGDRAVVQDFLAVAQSVAVAVEQMRLGPDRQFQPVGQPVAVGVFETVRHSVTVRIVVGGIEFEQQFDFVRQAIAVGVRTRQPVVFLDGADGQDAAVDGRSRSVEHRGIAQQKSRILIDDPDPGRLQGRGNFGNGIKSQRVGDRGSIGSRDMHGDPGLGQLLGV